MDSDTVAKRIADSIKNTPCAPKCEIDQYHAQIKAELDSGILIPKPSVLHRNLHQEMWITAHKVYEGYGDTSIACLDFFNGRNSSISEMIRFNVWYAKEYLVPEICQIDSWARDTRQRAEEESMNYFGRNLDSVEIKVA